jgi:hypothetical protein
MASIYKKAWASGAESPYWQAKLRGLNGRRVWLSTKQTEYRRAKTVASRWEECVELAGRQELRNSTEKIIAGIWKLTKSPATVENTTPGVITLAGGVKCHLNPWVHADQTLGARLQRVEEKPSGKERGNDRFQKAL